ncbi:MAG: hypothetical protein R3C05_05265 [Pirellulaceae bacterium]
MAPNTRRHICFAAIMDRFDEGIRLVERGLKRIVDCGFPYRKFLFYLSTSILLRKMDVRNLGTCRLCLPDSHELSSISSYSIAELAKWFLDEKANCLPSCSMLATATNIVIEPFGVAPKVDFVT